MRFGSAAQVFRRNEPLGAPERRKKENKGQFTAKKALKYVMRRVKGPANYAFY